MSNIQQKVKARVLECECGCFLTLRRWCFVANVAFNCGSIGNHSNLVILTIHKPIPLHSFLKLVRLLLDLIMLWHGKLEFVFNNALKHVGGGHFSAENSGFDQTNGRYMVCMHILYIGSLSLPAQTPGSVYHRLAPPPIPGFPCLIEIYSTCIIYIYIHIYRENMYTYYIYI